MEYFVHLGADSVDAIKQACGTEVEELNVTENGTYNAPSGKAYNPVTVNVESSGGDSDFSTAEVTIQQTYATTTGVSIATIPNDMAIYVNDIGTLAGPVIVPLYKGNCILDMQALTALGYATLSVTSGSAEIQGNFLVITGDCVIEVNRAD